MPEPTAKTTADRLKNSSSGAAWIAPYRSLLTSLLAAIQPLDAAVHKGELSVADAHACESLGRAVNGGFHWLPNAKISDPEAAAELRAALGVPRNVTSAVRRLSNAQASESHRSLIASCGALIDQSYLHLEAAVRSIGSRLPDPHSD
jgi:hypothetical protein